MYSGNVFRVLGYYGCLDLLIIIDEGDLGFRELKERMELNSSSLDRLLDSLCAAELVIKYRVGGKCWNSSRSRYHLTERGRWLLAVAMQLELENGVMDLSKELAKKVTDAGRLDVKIFIQGEPGLGMSQH